MFEYQNNNSYFAQIAGGMEDIGVEELEELGAQNVEKSFRGAYFRADKGTLYKINYMSRLLTRVLAPMKKFNCHSDKYLYKIAFDMEWNQVLSVDGTFAITANVSNSNITHSQYAALKLKDAIADWFRDKYGKRPSVDLKNPDIWFNLHISNNEALISLDASGGALHKRGYRQNSVEAPMQETLAAAIIKKSGWDGERRLYDPFCGSGTLIAEAHMKYCRIPAGYLRKKFGFENFLDFDEELWKKIKSEADAQIRELPIGVIGGSDIDKKATASARKNLSIFPHAKNIWWKVCSFDEIENLDDTTIVTNPPYGIRLGSTDEAAYTYKIFGNFLKRKCNGSTAYIYIGNRDLIGRVGLKTSSRVPLVNGSIEGRLCEYKMYRKY